MKCCFIGHRKINETLELKQKLQLTIEKLIKENNVKIFIFGSRNEFNVLCHKIVSSLQIQYPFIKKIVYTCQNEYAILKHDKEKLQRIISRTLKRDILLCDYDEEIEYKTKFSSGKSSYIQRNQAMINDSDFCIFYYNKDYKPATRKNKSNSIFEYQPNSGTAISINYARQKKKHIINIF